MASPVTVEIRAGMPEPMAGPAVGAIEPTTSISLSVTAALSRRVESGTCAPSATGAATAAQHRNAASEGVRIIDERPGFKGRGGLIEGETGRAHPAVPCAPVRRWRPSARDPAVRR